MAARMNKVAIHKFTILIVVIIYKYPLPLILLALYHLKLIQTVRGLIIGRMKVYLIQG